MGMHSDIVSSWRLRINRPAQMPLVIVGVLLLIGAIFAFSRRRFRNSLSGWGARAALASGTTTMTSSGGNGGQIRVLTADQLAGTTGTGNNRNNNNNNAGSGIASCLLNARNDNDNDNNNNNLGNTGRNRNRNPRRTRRTPSQISTTSLPAYMKEPGDQEVVIIRSVLITRCVRVVAMLILYNHMVEA